MKLPVPAILAVLGVVGAWSLSGCRSRVAPAEDSSRQTTMPRVEVFSSRGSNARRWKGWLTDWSWDTDIQRLHSPSGIKAAIRSNGGLSFRKQGDDCPTLADHGFLVMQVQADPCTIDSVVVSLEDGRKEYPKGGVFLRAAADRICPARDGTVHIIVPIAAFGPSGKSIRKINLINRHDKSVEVILRRLVFLPPRDITDIILADISGTAP